MGATSFGYEALFKSLYDSGKMHQVIFALDYFSFCRAMVPLDMYLYDDSVWNDYEYWINYTSLKNAIEKLTRRFRPSRDDVYRFKSPNNRQQLKKCYDKAVKSYFKGEDYDLKKLIERYDRMMDVIAPDKHDIKYYFYFPPYSILEYKLMEQYGYWDIIKQFKKYIIKHMLSFENVKIFDFQSAPMIMNMDAYMDLRHHSHEYNKLIIDCISKDCCLQKYDKYEKCILDWEKMTKSFHTL